jgi:hypothetical protein
MLYNRNNVQCSIHRCVGCLTHRPRWDRIGKIFFHVYHYLSCTLFWRLRDPSLLDHQTLGILALVLTVRESSHSRKRGSSRAVTIETEPAESNM